MCRAPSLGHHRRDTAELQWRLNSFQAAEQGEISHQPWVPSYHAPSQERDGLGNKIQFITFQKPVLRGISHCLTKCPAGLSLDTTGMG